MTSTTADHAAPPVPVQSVHKREVSLSDAEAYVLHRLLVDDSSSSKKQSDENVVATDDSVEVTASEQGVLDDDTLFSSVPTDIKEPRMSITDVINRVMLRGLWQAHAEGKAPLVEKRREKPKLKQMESSFEHEMTIADVVKRLQQQEQQIDRDHAEVRGEDDDSSSTRSDVEVRNDNKSTDSDGSSWDEDDHIEHYDTWAVLKDEYAGDFGFDYASRNMSMSTSNMLSNTSANLDDISSNYFSIIGTNVNDESAQPHVLSPPLMDALMNFIPEQLHDENYWLKFSLVRDGASMDTLKKYCKGSRYTILAIETPKGEVFGTFTSRSWRTHHGYYGSAPAFVWKMRQGRQTKCSSLYEQAKLETAIDVFTLTSKSTYVQVCRDTQLAVGGDVDVSSRSEAELGTYFNDANVDAGFALALEEDLMIGSTSPCLAFKSPALCGSGKKTEIFEVANLEVWTFTPMPDEKTAQRLEMTKYFADANFRSRDSIGKSKKDKNNPTNFTSIDLLQDKFYQRVGDDLEGDERRQRWQVSNTWNSSLTGNSIKSPGVGASPRFK